ncbi:hypothetical protein FB451DRAFT_1378580 [Mycena latifolia]|nr:hypothetical protein FB451DRAFT_1378580 [Mycena latifolia]
MPSIFSRARRPRRPERLSRSGLASLVNSSLATSSVGLASGCPGGREVRGLLSWVRYERWKADEAECPRWQWTCQGRGRGMLRRAF